MAQRHLHILIVAIPEYPALEKKLWEPLQGVRNDAEELRSTLERYSYLPIRHLDWLTDGEAKRHKVLAALDELADPARVAALDQVVVYLGGHGCRQLDPRRRRLGYSFLPFDAQPDPADPARIRLKTALSVHVLNDRLGRIRGREVVVILDCCYSGGMAPDWNSIADDLRAGWASRYVMAAARGRQAAGEVGDGSLARGFFIAPLCGALRGESVSTDAQGRISVQDAFSAAHKVMLENLQEYTLGSGAFDQIAVSSGVGAHIYLTQIPVEPAPFMVPFASLQADFVGRGDELESLDRLLDHTGPAGVRPAGLTGMGGIGKTRLAVEYAYSHRDTYTDGIFWVDAALPLAQGLAKIGEVLRPETRGSSMDQQVRAAFEELQRRPDALLILDNMADPAQLGDSISGDQSLNMLGCHILFTTRQRELGRFGACEVTVLPEEIALRLLLWHGRRRAICDDQGHPERPDASAICTQLGGLPLALKLAGAFLGENSELPLAEYRQRLQSEGCIATIDSELQNLSRVTLQRTHKLAVAATLKTQWDALSKGDDTARRVLRVAGQLAEAAAIPTIMLGLLAGVSHSRRPGRHSPLEAALKRLRNVRLIEDLRDQRVWIHPLVREFAAARTTPREAPVFRHECARRVAAALENISAWEDAIRSGGVDGLVHCVTTARTFASRADDGVETSLASMLEKLQREAHHHADLK
jgi:hypothetical protein